jgi:hypothetical protein
LIDETGKPIPLNPATNEPADSTKGRSVDISRDGKWCAVGFRDGNLRVYQTSDWKCVKRLQVSKNKWI